MQSFLSQTSRSFVRASSSSLTHSLSQSSCCNAAPLLLQAKRFSHSQLSVKLTTDVPGVGMNEEVVAVKVGYARNYLLAQNMAKYVSKEEMKRKEKIVDPALLAEEKLKQQNLFKRKAFDELKAAVKGIKITSVREPKQGDNKSATIEAARPVMASRLVYKLRRSGLIDIRESDVLFSNGKNQCSTFGDHVVNVKMSAFGMTETVPVQVSILQPIKPAAEVAKVDSADQKKGKNGRKPRGFSMLQ